MSLSGESLLAATLVGCSASLIFLYLLSSMTRARDLPLPPGPWSFPFIGNIKCLVWKPNWLTFTDWYHKYDSNIVHVKICGQSVLILNTLEAAKELLERRSLIYASRPQLTMVNELIGWKWAFTNMPYGTEWKACNKLFTHMFHKHNPEQHEPQALKAARNLILDLYKSPQHYRKHLRRMTGSTILSITYGFDINTVKDSDLIDTAEQALDGFVAASLPGSFLVDVIPCLKYVPLWFPGASFQRQARVWKEAMEKFLHEPFDTMKSQLTTGSVGPCFVLRSLEQLSGSDPDTQNEKEWLIKQTAGTMYLGGTDTTAVTLSSFFLAMAKWPEYQKKAQEELDRAVGNDRLPDFSDRENLPYIQAIVNEVIRWQPITPNLLPHLVTEEDTYNGYYIPKNSIVLGNAWAMLRDKSAFPDPHMFIPDRYICLANGKLNLEVLEPTAVFGFGRRICPGKHMALSAIWITVASVLAVFDISALDEDGHTINPPAMFNVNGLQNQPLPFRCSIKLRSPERLSAMKMASDFTEG